MLHSLLWRLNSEITRRCLEHPFVRGLADGTLEGEVFKRYVAQDDAAQGAVEQADVADCGPAGWQNSAPDHGGAAASGRATGAPGL